MANLNIPQEEDIKKWVRDIIRDELAILIPIIKNNARSGDRPFLTRKEVAAYLRISTVTLSDWEKRGLPAHRKRKRGRVLFIKEEVDEWMRQYPELNKNKNTTD